MARRSSIFDDISKMPWQVGVEKVRELLGSMVAGGAEHGVLVTTGEFTSGAQQFGNKHHIRLIDGKELEYLLGGTFGAPVPQGQTL